MAGHSTKRKRDDELASSSDSDSSGFEVARLSGSDREVDITSILTGKKGKNVGSDDGHDDFGELEDLIKQSVAKRDMKEGTKLLKKTKGKTSMAKGEVGGGSFQSMGLHPSLLRSLTLQGYKVPTPIQRLSIPVLLGTPPRDLVGMARTGSGKTLAYMIPLVQRLGGRHSSTFGTRALILVPARELAVQVLKVGKELARGWNGGSGEHAGDNEDTSEGKTQRLRWGLVVGGESLDEQFEMIASNPDVIIATPGRLLHLIVEMNLDLKAVQYVVFDEADRLFEMGFDTALSEILLKLPTSRQTLLFSATLPKSLVDFAKAGLQDPKLVRLDVESKISQDLRMAFFSVKQAEKEACLFVLLRDLVGVPLGSPVKPSDDEQQSNSKGKGKAKAKEHQTHAAPHQTLIFTATKHHVEYLMNLLTTAGYSVSHIYGALDQVARTQQMDRFRRGLTNILVVTDVAARGIDIPVLAHVINYDFPHGARVFVHRVGRTARAGRKGWAWSFVSATELPHMLDLQLFLGRPVKNSLVGSGEQPFVENLILGPFPRDKIDDEMEYIRSLDGENRSLESLREVMRKGQAMYERSQGKASSASYKRGKEMMKSGVWASATSVSLSGAGAHPVFKFMQAQSSGEDADATKAPVTAAEAEQAEKSRQALLRAVNSFTPSETVFEIGSRGKDGTAALMKDRRKALSKARERAVPSVSIAAGPSEDATMPGGDESGEDVEMADEGDIEATFTSGTGSSKNNARNYRDSEFYMSHFQKDANTEKGYSLKDGASFIEQARSATFDLAGDEGVASRQRHNSQLRWDRKKKKFIKGDGVGADNVKLVKTESGTKLPASYRSGRFEEWKAKTHAKLPRVGEAEGDGARRGGGGSGGKKFKHKLEQAAKPLDKLSNDYERKVRQLKKRQSDSQGAGEADNQTRPAPTSVRPSNKGAKGKAKPSRYGGKPIGRVKSELKSADQIRKTRELAERKRAKNARPSKKGKGRR